MEPTNDLDFAIDITDHKRLGELGETFAEIKDRINIHNPDWDHIRDVLSSGGGMSLATSLYEGDAPSIEEARGFIDGYVEIVHLRSGAQLLIDEEGHMKKLPLNVIASLLYGGPIAGRAMILKGSAKWT